MIIRNSGQTKPEYYAKAASTAISEGAAIKPNGSGQFVPGTSGAAVTALTMEKVTAQDSDYTSTRKLLCDNISNSEDIFEFDVETGTASLALVGTYVDLASSTGVDVSASTNDDVFVTGYVSTTKILGKFNKTSAVRG